MCHANVLEIRLSRLQIITITELLADPDKPNPRCLKIPPGHNPTFKTPRLPETSNVVDEPDLLSENNA